MNEDKANQDNHQNVPLAHLKTMTEQQKPERKTYDSLRKHWFQKYVDIMHGVPPHLPPLREINHAIPIIDEDKRYNYPLPKCPDAIKGEFMRKLEHYTNNGWWISAVVRQAAPLLCVPKKNGQLRTVFDLRLRNENTHRDVTPFPDQDLIRNDVANAKYRSKIDLSDAYEQIRIDPSDVSKTAFSTICGTHLSNVLQQGDCNGPSTCQRLMTHIFRDYIARFVHVYLDDTFVYSNTLEEHEKHLDCVFSKLKENQLYIKEEKCDLYSARMECLGHMIDNKGIHADEDKMNKIREWRTPRNFNDVERFLGLVQYIAHFMPDVSAFTGPLHGMVRNGHTFEWRPIHRKCFEMIKELASKAPILKPIDATIDVPIWVICDASTAGIGAVYGQGLDWQTCRPAGFMSRKFTPAQHAYPIYEMEMLAILQALIKWEDKLLGRKFNVITDHEALKFPRDRRKMANRQIRWADYLS